MSTTSRAASSRASSPSIRAEILSISPSPVLARLQLRPQLFRDRLASPEYPGANRPDRTVHDGRDILVAQTFKLAQSYCCPQFLRQILDGTIHGLGDLTAHQFV